MIDDGTVHWFAARTRRGQELRIRENLDRFGVSSFVPTVRSLRQRGGRKVKAIVPLVPNMVFLRATKSDACSLANGRGIPIYYIIDRSTSRMLVVPDKQMDDFIRVVSEEPETVEISGFVPHRGQKVRISSGRLEGVEGEVLTSDGGTFIIVSVGQLLNARIKVSKSCLVPVNRDVL